MKKLLLATAIALAVGGMYGCGGEGKVSFERQEANQRIAKKNAKINALQWKKDHAPKFNVSEQGDSTIGPKCAQGDGWASITLVKPHDWDDKVEAWRGPRELKLKCSTVSKAKGCLKSEVFKTKSYANEEGTCNRDLPDPLPSFES